MRLKRGNGLLEGKSGVRRKPELMLHFEKSNRRVSKPIGETSRFSFP